MILVALDKDEIYPYFIADDQYSEEMFHDAVVEVDKGWWEEYSMVRAKFWDMQNELASLYYGGEDLEVRGQDCE